VSAIFTLDLLCLAGVLAAATIVIRTDNLNSAVMALSASGAMLALLFVVLDAPDDAHSEVVVGAIALPVLYLLAIARIRAAVDDERELGDMGEVGSFEHDEPAPQ
jgi:uncharacterized MnhB-related membrane protein